jgi:N-acetylglucosamine-6-sulfatase
VAATCLVLLMAGLGAVRAFRGPLPTADAAQPTQRARKPNIVVVMADDMRFDDLMFAPTVRRLASRGVTFHNSFSSFPLCCPARASFLTGQLPHNHHIYWHLRPYGYGAFDDSRTLATSLRRSGYLTGFVGKYLNGYGIHRSKVTGGPSYR